MRLILLLATAILCRFAVAAVEPPRERFSALPGGPPGGIAAIVEDASGLLWIGGDAGLHRHDGQRAQPIAIGDGSPRVFDLALVEAGIYIAHESGLAFWSRTRAAIEPLACAPLANGVRSVQALPDGLLALGLGALVRLSREGTDCMPMALAGAPAGVPIEVARMIHGETWLALREQGLWRCEQACARVRPWAPALATTRVRWISDDGAGGLYVGTHRHGLYRLDAQGAVIDRWYRGATDPTRALPTMGVMSLARKADGSLWIGLWAGGLIGIGADGAIRSRSRAIPQEPTAIRDDHVAALLLAANGTLYLGHEAGVDLRDPRRNQSRWIGPAAPGQPGLTRADVVSLHREPDGTLWVGSERGGLQRFAADGIRALRHDPARPDTLPHDTVWDIAAAGPDWLWLATSGGLARVHRRELRVERVIAYPRLPSDDVIALAPAGDGGIYIAMWAGGVARIGAGGELLQLWRAADGLRSETIAQLLRDRAGRVHCINNEGWQVLGSDGRFASVALPPRAPAAGAQRIATLHEDAQGRLWAAGVAGALARWDPAQAAPAWLPGAGATQAIGAIVARAGGGAWLGLADRVIAVDDHGEPLPAPPLDARVGLDEPNVADSRMLVDAAGLLTIGGHGVYVIDPTAIERPPAPAAPLVTGVRLFNQPLAPADQGPLLASTLVGGPLRLRYDQDLITLDFALPGQPAPPGLRFRYRLIGFDPRWIEVSADEARAVYTRLPPGDFGFEVGAGDAVGWFAARAQLPIEVLPPWWMTWWARGSGLALLLCAIVAAWRLRTWQLRAQALRLEQRVAERTAELAAANAALDRAARTDPLTGLANRRGFLAAIEPVYAQPASLALMDIDHFKSINDRYGHDVGDAVLVEVARRLREALRSEDQLGRWGGEEFVVRIAGDAGAGVAERLRSAIGEAPFPPGIGPEHVTVSIGTARVRAGDSVDACLQRADAALYAGKRGGRNRVVDADTLDALPS